MTEYKNLRELVLSHSETDWFKEHKANIMFELNHCELHNIDSYYLNLYNAGVRNIEENEANSSIAYLLGIVTTPPTGKVHTVGGGFPDIDSDVEKERRPEVFEMLKDKYGDGFAHLGTLTYTGGKKAFKDAARIHGMGFEKANKISSMMPDIGCPPLDVLLEEDDAIKALYSSDPEVKEVWDDAINLSNCVSQLGVHACYVSGSFIRTFSGLKNIEDVQVGDFVLTDKGHYKQVVKTMVSKSDDVYRIRTGPSGDFMLTGNHPIFAQEIKCGMEWNKGLQKTVYRHKLLSGGFKSVSDLDITRDFLKLGYSKLSIIPYEDPENRYNIDFSNPDFWWICGLYMTDGWREFVKRKGRNNTIRFNRRLFLCCEKLEDKVEEISRRLKSAGIGFRIDNHRTCYKFALHIVGNRLFDYFGTFGDKCENKAPNSDVFNLPKHLLKEFLEGYFYGDGSKEDNGKVQSFHSVSKKLVYSMPELIFKAFGAVCGIETRPLRVGKIEGRTVNCKESYRGRFRYNSESHVSGIPIGNDLYVTIKDIEKVDGIFDVYNLTVEDDHTYVANSLVTHNCGVALSDRPLWEDVPLWDSKGDPVIQWEGNKIEETSNVVKLDVLGLKTLTVLNFARELIKKRHGIDIDWYSLPMDNEAAYKVLWNERNYGIFQFEEAGMSGFVNACRPKTIHDIAVIVSTYRPGPLNIPGLVQRIIGKISGELPPTKFRFPKYDHIFSNAHNELIFQEGSKGRLK